MWDYLDSLGILEKGTDEEIKTAKKAYRKIYLSQYKKQQRSKKPEFSINFSNENGEYNRVKHAAKRHKMPITGFIRSAVLAYIEARFVVPDALQVAKLEQSLADCLNEIQAIARRKEKSFWGREDKLAMIEKTIEKLEVRINTIFRNPPLANP